MVSFFVCLQVVRRRPLNRTVIHAEPSKLSNFTAKHFDLRGTSWEQFSRALATQLPLILRETDWYFDEFPAARHLARYIRFDYSLCKCRICWYLSGPDLSLGSGKFATATVEIIALYLSTMNDASDDEANDLGDEYERGIVSAIIGAIDMISDAHELHTYVVQPGFTLKLKDEDSRCSPREFFPTLSSSLIK